MQELHEREREQEQQQKQVHTEPLRSEREGFYVGLDLGQANDYTALVVVEKIITYMQEARRDDGPWLNHHIKTQNIYHVRHVERFPLGTPYPTITKTVAEKRMNAPQLNGNAILIVDKTGVGRAPVELLHEAGLGPVGITITGGDSVSRDDAGDYRVPKRDLASTIKVLLQNGQLKFAEKLPLAELLKEELLNFRVKISEASGHDSYEAWREKDHDDIVLATALACWYAENGAIPNIRLIGPEL
jgi:hypothetical protein